MKHIDSGYKNDKSYYLRELRLSNKTAKIFIIDDLTDSESNSKSEV